MIGLSSKTVYAVAALYELGSGPTEKLTKIRDIAEATGISRNFLEQILLELRKGGFLESVKGARGGYRLAKTLSNISLGEIMEVLENDPFVNPCKTDNPVLECFWQDRKEELERTLNLPLSELHVCEQRLGNALNYTI